MSVQDYAVKHGVNGTDLSLLTHKLEFWAQFVHDTLALQIPDFDALLGGRNQPVPVRAEAQSINNVTGVQRIQALSFRQVPQHCHAVLASAGAEGAVW